MVAVFTYNDGRTKTTHFGAKGMSDYNIHKDPERKKDTSPGIVRGRIGMTTQVQVRYQDTYGVNQHFERKMHTQTVQFERSKIKPA